MKINSTRFGELEINEGKIIEFPMGIPGFADLKRYILLDYKDPIRWLHAVDDPDVAFIVADPFPFFPGYSFNLNDTEEQFLGIKDPSDIVALVILNAENNTLTVNLRAPIIANISGLKAAQILLDDERYSFKEPFPSLSQEGSK